MNAILSLDIHALEAALLDHLEQVRNDEPLAPVLVLAPTRRLTDHLARAALRRREAWFNVGFFHYRAVAFRILERAGRPIPQLLSRRQRLRLLERALERRRRNFWADYVRERPSAAGALLEALEDLRDAGVQPEAWPPPAEHTTAREEDLRAVYAAYVNHLDQAARAGWADDAALMEQAIRHAEPYARDLAHVVSYGAYELIGIHWNLLRTLSAHAPLTVFSPGHPEAPAGAYARKFWGDTAGARLAPAAAPPGRSSAWSTRLDRLFTEADAAPLPSDAAPMPVLRDVQGPFAELQWALSAAFSQVRDGADPQDVAILARTLEPYRPSLARWLEETDVPAGVRLEVPLEVVPAVRDFLRVLEIAQEDFPGGPTVEALSSPRIRWDRLARGARATLGPAADFLRRVEGVLGGLDTWKSAAAAARGRAGGDGTEDQERRRPLPAKMGIADQDLDVIPQALEALAQRLRPDDLRSGEDHARVLRDLAAELLDGWGAPEADAAMETILFEMERSDWWPAAGARVPFRVCWETFRRSVRETRVLLGGEPEGPSLRILDFMEARGLTFSKVVLMGFHGDVLPRVPREDPFLPDGVRERLRRELGVPLPLKLAAEQEEQLLFASVLGSAREICEVLFQRADETGKFRAPSLWLRELARMSLGRPDIEALLDKTFHVPADPADETEYRLEVHALLAPEEARVLAAVRSGSVPEALGVPRQTRHGLVMLREIERFDLPAGRYDGRVGGCQAPASYSPSSLEQLGRCPLRYCLERVARIEPLPDTVAVLEADPLTLGAVAHEVLRQVYEGVPREDGDGTPVPVNAAWARARVERAWAECAADLRARLGSSLPVYWEPLEEAWIQSLADFVVEDVASLSEGGLRIEALEENVEGEVHVPCDHTTVPLRGRVDRRLGSACADDGGGRISDYKTGRIEKLGNMTQVLKGRALQGPLYLEMVSRASEVEFLGIGPGHEADAEDEKDRRVVFRRIEAPELREGFLETVGVLASLPRRGVFPFREEDRGWCTHCPYDRACRRRHPPSRHREEHARDAEDFRLLGEKQQRRPTLASVRPSREDA